MPILSNINTIPSVVNPPGSPIIVGDFMELEPNLFLVELENNTDLVELE